MYFKRNKEVKRGYWFGEEDDIVGFRLGGFNIFFNRKVRYKV